MTLRDDLVRAAVYRAYDLRCEVDTPGWTAYLAAVAEVVFVHRCWPLIEYEHAIEKAARARGSVEVLVEELRAARRDATLGWARVAVLEAGTAHAG